MRRLREESGFTIIEALMASIIVGLGLVGSIAAFDAGRSLDNVTAKKQAAARHAQQEIEAIRALGWAGMRLSAAPATMPPTGGGVLSVSTYSAPSGGAVEPLVIGASCAASCVAPMAPWNDGNASGTVWRFITQAKDTACGATCTSAVDRKRITVVMSLNGSNAPTKPIVVSTYVIDPDDRPANSQGSGNPVQSTGGNSIGGATGTTYYLSDSPLAVPYLAPSADHPLRDTASANGTPDQLRGPTPPAPLDPTRLHSAYTYSTDAPPGPFGGRSLAPSARCEGTAKEKAHLWATPVLSAATATTATGNAALSLPTYTLGGTPGAGKLCATVLDVLADAVTGKILQARELGSVSFALPSWPEQPEPITFPFRFLPTGTTAVLAPLHRLGLRLSADDSAGGISVVYDHPDFAASVQLETK